MAIRQRTFAFVVAVLVCSASATNKIPASHVENETAIVAVKHVQKEATELAMQGIEILKATHQKAETQVAVTKSALRGKDEKAADQVAVAQQAVTKTALRPPPPGASPTGGKAETGSTEEQSSIHWSVRVGAQLLFGLVYYLIIVSKYPALKDVQPSAAAIELQKENEVMATCKVSGTNCLLSWCCSGPRAAHTMHSTGILNYWIGLFAMTCFPCCTLWCVNSFTNLNEKLGGERRNCCMGFLCACCCSCCVIAQDAESLDITMGVKTGFCGISENHDA